MTEALGIEGVCIGHIASGFIDRDQVLLLAEPMAKNEYGQYLLRIVEDDLAKEPR